MESVLIGDRHLASERILQYSSRVDSVSRAVQRSGIAPPVDSLTWVGMDRHCSDLYFFGAYGMDSSTVPVLPDESFLWGERNYCQAPSRHWAKVPSTGQSDISEPIKGSGQNDVVLWVDTTKLRRICKLASLTHCLSSEAIRKYT